MTPNEIIFMFGVFVILGIFQVWYLAGILGAIERIAKAIENYGP